MTDRELVERIGRGEQEAFDLVFRTHYAPLVGLAERMLRERATAEEVVQDVMLELWRRRESLALEESLRAYLFRAVRNRALNQLRHERVQREAEPRLGGERSTAPVAHLRLVEEEIDAALREGVEALSPRTREVFELSRVHGLKHAEIAAALGISVKGVEAQMGKALRELRARLGPWIENG